MFIESKIDVHLIRVGGCAFPVSNIAYIYAQGENCVLAFKEPAGRSVTFDMTTEKLFDAIDGALQGKKE